jgi:hypothetical protein
MNIEIVNDRKEILALAGYGLYQSELEEKLSLFKDEDIRTRHHWNVKDLDIYLRKRISSAIVKNEFMAPEAPKRGRMAKPKTDKEVILELSVALNMEIMAVKFLYHEVKEQLQLSSTKSDDRNFVSAQLYAHLDDLDLRIADAETDRDKQKWYELKLKAIDQFSKIKNLEEKQSNNTAIVHGNVNNQSNTTIDKQIVITEQEAMLKLLKTINILPKGE